MKPLQGLVVAAQDNAATIRLITGRVVNALVGHIMRYGDLVHVAFDYTRDSVRCVYPEGGMEVDDFDEPETPEKEWLEE